MGPRVFHAKFQLNISKNVETGKFGFWWDPNDQALWKWQFLVILSTFWLGESSIWKKKFVAVQLMTKSLGSDKTLRRRRNKQELLLPMQYIESSRSFVRVDLTYFSYLGTSPAASWRAHHFPFPLRLFHTCRCCWIAKRRCNSQTSITIN